MVSNKAPTNEGNKRTGNQMANRQRFKPGMGKPYGPMNNMRNMNAMFNANQLGDDPGFLDFNDDSITSTNSGPGNNFGGPITANGSDAGNKAPFVNGNRRMNVPMKRPMKNGAPGGGMRHRMNGGGNGMPNWGGPMAPPNMFPGPPAPAGRRGPMHPPPLPPPVPPAHFRNGMRMRGPQNGRFGAGPPGPMSLLAMNRPIPPPIPPMGGRPMPPPPGMGRMMPPPMRQGPDGGPMRRNMNGNMHARVMGGKMNPFPRNGMAPNGGGGGVMGPMGKRMRPRPTQQQNREEYPLDKPWVTEEIKGEHDKKTDLANRLKGHRDDALFAQFKEQRDKFVKMYEAARLEYIGKHPEQKNQTLAPLPPLAQKQKQNQLLIAVQLSLLRPPMHLLLRLVPPKPMIPQKSHPLLQMSKACQQKRKHQMLPLVKANKKLLQFSRSYPYPF
uniref:Uncharacterized protein n=1 Tax=Anopheles farauti TaxID=69004 RepID=A0A182QQJ9_9DIPT